MKKRILSFLLLSVLLITTFLSSYVNTQAAGSDSVTETTFEGNRFITKKEQKRVYKLYSSFLDHDLENFPCSFTLGEKNYKGFPSMDFQLISQEVYEKNNGEFTESVLKHKDGLLFKVISEYYREYNAIGWTIYVTNKGQENSSYISNFYGADIDVKGKDPIMFGNYGDSRQWEPYRIDMDASGIFDVAPIGGRSTQGDSSYFSYEYGKKGFRFAVGWPGEWVLHSRYEDGTTNIKIGQRALNTYLKPDETIRTPLTCFVLYDGRNDQDRTTNLWRHFMIDCNMPKTVDEDGSETNLPPTVFAGTSVQYGEMTQATDANQINGISYYVNNDIPITHWWMDAGWYYGLNQASQYYTFGRLEWGHLGTWQVDTSRFPSKFRAISDYAAENDIKTLLWFEVERALWDVPYLHNDGSTIKREWLINDLCVNLGNEEALEWIINRVTQILSEGGISVYREDVNYDPLPYWEAQDAREGRMGITENKYIQGHLKLWDAIKENIPGIMIDSCASGGKRNDLETMRRAVPLHKTDFSYGNRTAQQNIAAEMARYIPYFGTKANGDMDPGNNTRVANKYSLRTAMASAMVLGYDTAVDVPIDWNVVRKAVLEHQKIAGYNLADYYTLYDWNVSEEVYSGWEYLDPEEDTGYAIIYRRLYAPDTTTVKFKGLDPEKKYKISFEDHEEQYKLKGSVLMEDGIDVYFDAPNSSDIIYIEPVKSRK